MNETRDVRLRRLRMRSWRRGTREMDLILGPFADAEIGRMDETTLVAFEALLSENDQDLFYWISGQGSIPSVHRSLIVMIRAYRRSG